MPSFSFSFAILISALAASGLAQPGNTAGATTTPPHEFPYIPITLSSAPHLPIHVPISASSGDPFSCFTSVIPQISLFPIFLLSPHLCISLSHFPIPRSQHLISYASPDLPILTSPSYLPTSQSAPFPPFSISSSPLHTTLSIPQHGRIVTRCQYLHNVYIKYSPSSRTPRGSLSMNIQAAAVLLRDRLRDKE